MNSQVPNEPLKRLADFSTSNANLDAYFHTSCFKTLPLKEERKKKFKSFLNAFGHQNDAQAGQKTRANFHSVFCTQITEQNPVKCS